MFFLGPSSCAFGVGFTTFLLHILWIYNAQLQPSMDPHTFIFNHILMYSERPISPRRRQQHQFTLRPILTPPKQHSLIQEVIAVDIPHAPSQRNFSTYQPTKRYHYPAASDSISRVSRDELNDRVTNDSRQPYQHVERILKQQNSNLKGQNQLLLAEVERLRKQNRKYKQLCAGQELQIEGVRAESAAQRARGDQMKMMINSRLHELEEECLNGQSSVDIDILTDSNHSLPYN